MAKRNTYKLRDVVSGIIMLMALAWLTVSLPYVNESKQASKQFCKNAEGLLVEDNSSPFSNTTEEKSESGVNTLSEYLHDPHVMEHDFITLSKFYKCHPSDLYFEFTPELISPPPEV
jgi:hypothetical protein